MHPLGRQELEPPATQGLDELTVPVEQLADCKQSPNLEHTAGSEGQSVVLKYVPEVQYRMVVVEMVEMVETVETVDTVAIVPEELQYAPTWEHDVSCTAGQLVGHVQPLSTHESHEQ